MTAEVTLSKQERYALITRGIEEIIGGESIQQVLDANERPLRCYWGTACLLYTSPSPRDVEESRMPSSA